MKNLSLSSYTVKFKSSFCKTFCSKKKKQKNRGLCHLYPMSAHALTLTCIQTNVCKLGRFLSTLHPSRSPLVTYSVSNCTQAKNRSHAEAQHTLHQPVHIRASNTSRDHDILKGGSGFQLWGKPLDGADTVTSPRHSSDIIRLHRGQLGNLHGCKGGPAL